MRQRGDGLVDEVVPNDHQSPPEVGQLSAKPIELFVSAVEEILNWVIPWQRQLVDPSRDLLQLLQTENPTSSLKWTGAPLALMLQDRRCLNLDTNLDSLPADQNLWIS